LAVLFEYFKKKIDSNKILVRINPSTLEGLELLISETGKISKNIRTFDSTIYDDLNFDEFEKSSPLEFNLYLSGIGK
jgi:hypothetical protein